MPTYKLPTSQIVVSFNASGREIILIALKIEPVANKSSSVMFSSIYQPRQTPLLIRLAVFATVLAILVTSGMVIQSFFKLKDETQTKLVAESSQPSQAKAKLNKADILHEPETLPTAYEQNVAPSLTKLITNWNVHNMEKSHDWPVRWSISYPSSWFKQSFSSASSYGPSIRFSNYELISDLGGADLGVFKLTRVTNVARLDNGFKKSSDYFQFLSQLDNGEIFEQFLHNVVKTNDLKINGHPAVSVHFLDPLPGEGIEISRNRKIYVFYNNELYELSTGAYSNHRLDVYHEVIFDKMIRDFKFAP